MSKQFTKKCKEVYAVKWDPFGAFTLNNNNKFQNHFHIRIIFQISCLMATNDKTCFISKAVIDIVKNKVYLF